MKPLLCIAVTLSAAWLAYAAPQPLSLINVTAVSDVSDVTTTVISDSTTSDDSQRSTSTLPSTNNEMRNIADAGGDDTGNSLSTSEFVIPKEELDITLKSNDDVREGTTFTNSPGDVVSTESKSTVLDDSHEETHRTTGTSEPGTTNNEENTDRSEVTVSRYVPPLDPMKHMLMMADVKGIPNFAVKLNPKPLPTTTETSIFEETDPNEEVASTESSDEIERVVAESSELEENHEPVVVTGNEPEATVSDINSSTAETSESPLKPEELSSVKDLDTETSVDSSSTLSLSTSTSAGETTLPSTVKPTIEEETLAVHKNSETVLNTIDITTEKEKELFENEGETTAAVFTSTEEAIRVDVTSANTLLKNVEEIETETSLLDIETTTMPSSTEESDIGVKNSEINPVEENKEVISTSSSVSTSSSISTTSTTVVPETTFETSSASPTILENEKMNISIEDELEFRAVKFPLNASKIEYADEIFDDTTTVEFKTDSESDTELTTASILTTIAEILFSPSTSDAPEILLDEKDEKISTLLAENESDTTDLPLSAEKLDLDAESDTGAILSNDPADMLKVQSVTAGLDSVPAEDATTDNPSTESTVTLKQPEESSTELDIATEDLSENAQNEKLYESTEKYETTSKVSSTLQDTTTTFSTTTEAFTPPPTSDSENIDLKNSETLESKPEDQNDPSDKEKPSDYLFNIKDRYISGENKDMVAAVQFLHYHDKASSEHCHKLVNAHWNYATNLTETNKKKQLEQTLEYSKFHKAAWKNATSFAWKSFNDTLLRRWFKSLSVLGTAALPEEKLNEFNKLKAEMKNIYSTARVCNYIPPENVTRGQILREQDCNLTLEPDLQRILTKSRDYDELVHVWKSWRDASGKPIREKFLRYTELSNEAARLNGFSDTGDMWREAYESETFENDLEEIWEQLKPLYVHLHAYVRRRLTKQYGEDKIKDDGPIPAHLFGNMWAQSWVSLLDITQPFPGKPSVDVTPNMEAKNLTAYQMFKISEEFFTSLGLKPMPELFWKHSLIERPKDGRDLICHASAWDFCNGRDYRIKQCTDITMQDLITVHHEMGHIQYFLQYARQPNVFREGANPGFHEAVGDVLALSASTPKHLQSIGLLDEVADDLEGDLNHLLYTALDKISFLPSAYLIDLWRWGLFKGDIKPEEMNTKWWYLRLKYQGVCPPVKRTETDFDPGSKFHVPGSVPYIRYFVSFVIQFQFHKVLCDAAGHTGPLHKCDVYRSKDAGQILSQVMELGSSEHWSEAMKIMTGGATNKMDAGPVMEYFNPLFQFLKKQNQNQTLGWSSDDATVCP